MSKTHTKQSPTRFLFQLRPELLVRFKSLVPEGQRSSVLTTLLESELERRERKLEEVARLVEADTEFNEDMKAWEVTIGDGIDEYVPPYNEKR